MQGIEVLRILSQVGQEEVIAPEESMAASASINPDRSPDAQGHTSVLEAASTVSPQSVMSASASSQMASLASVGPKAEAGKGEISAITLCTLTSSSSLCRSQS